MRLAFPLFVVACLSACGSNPPCTECPDIRGRYTMVFDAVPVEKSTCLRYFSEVAEFEVVVQQTNSEIIVQPMEWKATLYEDLSLRFEPWDGETSDGHRTREHLKGRLSLEPGVTFKGTLSGQIPTQSCGISIPVSWR